MSKLSPQSLERPSAKQTNISGQAMPEQMQPEQNSKKAKTAKSEGAPESTKAASRNEATQGDAQASDVSLSIKDLSKPDKSKKAAKMTLREGVSSLVWALVLAIIIRTFIFQAFTIPSGSMEQTLLIGDYLLVSKFSYGIKVPFTSKYLVEFDDPERGDIIVFRYPLNPKENYVKRVVGVPGDVIEMRNKQLYRNNEPVEEAYIQNTRPHYIGPLDNLGPITIPEGQYFAMGDNRDNSSDSRVWGTVERHLIHGKAWRIYWSWDSMEKRLRFGRLGMKLE